MSEDVLMWIFVFIFVLAAPIVAISYMPRHIEGGRL